MKIIIGKNTAVSVQKTLGTAKAVTACSKAANPALTVTGHGLAVGDWVLCAFPGTMAALDGQIARVKTVPDASSITLEGVDTSFAQYTAYSGSDATVTKISAWEPFDNVKTIEVSDGAPDRPDASTVHDTRKQSIIGLDGELTGSLQLGTNPSQAAVALLRAAAIGGTKLAVLVVNPTQTVAFNAEWAGGRGFSLATGQISNTQMSLTVKGELAYV